MNKKKLSDLSLDELDDEYFLIRNIECDYILGFMTNEDAMEVFDEVEDPFPLSADSIIDYNVRDAIEGNCIVGKDKVRRHIYENMDVGEDEHE